jgi:cytochrome b561
MAAIILFLLGLGIYMVYFLSKEDPGRMGIYALHKSFGVMVLAFISVRIINRFINKAPALPDSLPKFDRLAAHFVHVALYLLMILVPISGYLMSNSFGYPVHFFGIELPFLVEKNYEIGSIFSKTHQISAYSMIALLTLHILGALKHRFFDKPENDVLKRII